MSDSESSKSGTESSSGSESGSSSSSSRSSRSSASSASSKQSVGELQRAQQGARESSSESDSSRSSRSTASSKSSLGRANRSGSESSSASDSSRSSLARNVTTKPRSGSISSKSSASQSSRTGSGSSSSEESSDSEAELGRGRGDNKEQDGSDSSSDSSTSSSSVTSSSRTSASATTSSGSETSSSEESSSSSSESDSSDSEAGHVNTVADRDTLRMDKRSIEPIKENQIKIELGNEDKVQVNRRNSIGDFEEDPAIANNPWVKLGKFLDKIWFSKYFLPITGSFSIFLAVVFSILLDIRVSGLKGLPYGISFIFLMILFLFWATMLVLMALSRVRYANNIQMVPGNGSLFEKSMLNKEGARIGAFICTAITFVLFFVFLVLLSVNVDKNPSPWAHSKGGLGWKEVFVPMWIALAFIAIGITFCWRLLKSYVTIFFHVVITACSIALTIAIYNRIQGNIGNNYYTVLVPLWFLDFFVFVAILWHTLSRVVSKVPHLVTVFKKSKKEQESESARNQFAAVPLSIAGCFMLLFQVCCVIKTENVFVGKYKVTWSIVWLWFWLAMAFLTLWVWTYRPNHSAARTKRVSKA